MKNKGLLITIIILLSLLVVGLTSVMVLAIRNDGVFRFGIHSTESTEKVYGGEYDIETVKRIYTKTDAADIDFKKSKAVDTIELTIYADETTTEYSAELVGDELEITTKTKCKYFCFNNKSAKIEILLPEEYAGSAKIISDAGDINFDQFKNLDIHIEADAGDITIAAAKNVHIETDAGDIDIASAETIEIDSDAGDVDIDYCFGKLSLDIDAGDVKINRLALTDNSSIDVDAGNIQIENVGDVNVSTSNNVGNRDINGGNPQSNILLYIKNDFGNIEVK